MVWRSITFLRLAMKKTLILHSSVDGHTIRICGRIASSLTGEVKVLAIQDASADLSGYDKIVIGASIRYGRHRDEVINYVVKNKRALNAGKSAFFSVNAVARKEGKDTPVGNPYVRKFLQKTSWNPEIVGVFAGRIDYPKYGFLDKFAIKLIMRITGGPTDTSSAFEFTDWNRVDDFIKKVDT